MPTGSKTGRAITTRGSVVLPNDANRNPKYILFRWFRQDEKGQKEILVGSGIVYWFGGITVIVTILRSLLK